MPAIITAIQIIGSVVAGSMVATTGIGMFIAGAATIIGAGALVYSTIQAFSLKMPKMDSNQSRQRTVRSTMEAQKIIYGTALVSGPITFVDAGGTDNQDLYHAIALAGHECEDITDIYFDNELILDSAINGGASSGGNVTTGTFGPINSNTICKINKHLGSSTQTADSDLVAAFTNYTANHRGRGIAYIVTKWTLNEDSQETWDKLSPNDIRALVKGRKVYDPRDDTSAGANPTSASYISFSDNPALCLADYLTNDTFGVGIATSKIDWASVVSAANVCDTTVAIPTSSTEKRFTCNGVLFGGNSHKSNIDKILSSFNGMLTYTGGNYTIRAGAYESPSESLNEDDLAGPIEIITSTERSNRFNTIKGLFIDPSQNHKSMEFPRVQLTAALNRDNSIELTKDIQLPMTNSSYMAQRIANKMIQLSDHQTVVQFPTNLTGLKVAVGDRVQVTVEELNWSNKVFQCVAWSYSDSNSTGVNLTLKEDSSGSYADPAEGDYSTTSATGTITPGFRGVPDPQNLTATSILKGVELNWTNPSNSKAYEEIIIYTSSSSAWSGASEIGRTRGTQFIHDASNESGLVPGNTRYYWIRAAAYSGVGTGAGALSDRNPDSDTSTVSATVGYVNWSDVNDDGNAPDDNATNNPIYRQDAAPTVVNGAIWVDTDDGFLYEGRAGSWQLIGSTNEFEVLGSGVSLPGTVVNGKYVLVSDTNKMYRGEGGAWVQVSGTGSLASKNTAGNADIDDDAVDHNKIDNTDYIQVGSGSTSATLSGIADEDWRIFAGADESSGSTAPFRVKTDGTVVARKMVLKDTDGTTYFDSSSGGFSDYAKTVLAEALTATVSTLAGTTSTNTADFVVATTTASQTVTASASYPVDGMSSQQQSTSSAALAQIPSSITLTINKNQGGGSYSELVSQEFTRTTGTPTATQYRANVIFIGSGYFAYVQSGLGCLDSGGNINHTFSGTTWTNGTHNLRLALSYTGGSSTGVPSVSEVRTISVTGTVGFAITSTGGTESTSGTYLPLSGGTLTGTVYAANLRAKGQIRATGWYGDTAGDGEGTGIEIGTSSGYGYVLSYDRTNSLYKEMHFNADDYSFYGMSSGAIVASDKPFVGPSFKDINDMSYLIAPTGTSQIKHLKVMGSTNNSTTDSVLYVNATNNNDWLAYLEGTSSKTEYGLRVNLAGTNSYMIYAATPAGLYFRVGTDLARHTVAMQAPIYYDDNDTSYYFNGGTTTNVNQLNVQGHALRDGGQDGRNLHLFGASGTNGSHGVAGYDNSGVWRWQLYGTGSNWGLLNAEWGSWDFRKASGGSMFLNNQTTYYIDTENTYMNRVYGVTDIRSPLFYANNDTTYYIQQSSAYWKVQTNAGYFHMGSGNSSWVHFITDGKPFYIQQSTNFDNGIYDYSSNWSVIDSYGHHGASWRAPVFYDYNDTSYYVDPHNTVVCLNLAGGDIRFQSASWTGEVPGKIAYHSSYWYLQSVNGFYFRNGAGNFAFFHSDSSGNTYSYTSSRAPLFYDTDNTAYYIDGAATSVLAKIHTIGSANGGTPRWDTSFYVAQSQHYYGQTNSQSMYLGESNHIYIRTIGEATGSLRAPIFYDVSNTGRYTDPASASYMDTIHTYNWFRSQGNSGWYSQSYAGGIWMQDSSWIRTYGSKNFYVDASIYTAGNVVAYYSDERLKDIEGPIENALEKVESLEGFVYTENEIARELGYTNDKKQLGVSAQSVQKIFPYLVERAAVDIETAEYGGEQWSKSGEEYLTLDYSRLVPLCIQAIKESNEIIKNLTKRIEELENDGTY